jgi:hypothetical protein
MIGHPGKRLGSTDRSTQMLVGEDVTQSNLSLYHIVLLNCPLTMSNTLDKTNTLAEQDDSAPSTPRLYRHTFFSIEGAPARKALVPSLILPLFYNAILLWVCLALFFGSLLKNNDVSRISIMAVNLDDGPFGDALMHGVKRSLEEIGPHLKWVVGDDSVKRGDGWSREQVLAEKTWAVLQISANASSALREALQQGDPSYDPMSAVTLYYASARNQVTTLAVAVPAAISLANRILSDVAVTSTASFLQSAVTASDVDSLSTALRCPQCLAFPFAVKQVDLIPFSSAAAFGTLNTG